MGDGTIGAGEPSSKACIGDVLRNLKNAKRYAFDIGSSIVKIAYCSSVPSHTASTDPDKKLNDVEESFRLHFIELHISRFQECLQYIREECSLIGTDSIACTGSNIDAYQPRICDLLSLKCVKLNEMECLAKGNNFLLRNVLDESFIYDHKSEACNYVFQTIDPSTVFPYLIVNVSTGVSIYKVESDDVFERIGGSSIGGGTFHGLGNLMANCSDFDKLMSMAESGDHRNVDVLVSDLQGAMLESLCLSNDLIAGSFGKCEDTTKRGKADLIRSLLLMISNSIGQISVLYAQKINAKSIFFGGYFVRNHAISMRTISYAVNYWSQGKMSARFLRHEGYTAAIGAFIKQNENVAAAALNPSAMDKCHELSWKEHYAGCSALGRFVPTAPLSSTFEVGRLEMECCNMKLQTFPLLTSYEEYIPDTVNLNDDVDARDYWISCMEKSVQKTLTKAVESDKQSPDAELRANLFKDRYLSHLKIIKEKSFAYGCCNVRNLLDLREQILNEQLFDDAFLCQKQIENELAVRELPNVLRIIDAIDNVRDRQIAVCKGILAGNVFDWGAKEAVKMMESSGGLSFSSALELIPERPWLVDELDDWLKSVSAKHYRCAAIFVDNSGGDVLLGVIPFARELLKMGTKVIIVCNWSPALNDVTYNELVALMPEICAGDPILAEAVKQEQLEIEHSGQGSPCLDLRRVNSKLCEKIKHEGVDLVVIEGMGRALHTNYYAEFECDSLKVAVIKTKWLADRLGGAVFSTIFKFQQGSLRL
uniref:4'-phosphopantetheine phosphatase n=1 Tax=Steinernema glaseri TaxID=37863 RepID=A0A1I7ZER0_9BILA